MFFRSFSFSIIFSSSKVLNNSLFALWSFFRTFHLFYIFKISRFRFFAIFQCFLFSLHLFFIVKLFFALKYLKFGSKSFYSSLFHRSRLSFFKVSIFHSGGLQTHLFFIFSFFLRFSLIFPDENIILHHFFITPGELFDFFVLLLHFSVFEDVHKMWYVAVWFSMVSDMYAVVLKQGGNGSLGAGSITCIVA